MARRATANHALLSFRVEILSLSLALELYGMAFRTTITLLKTEMCVFNTNRVKV